jgi:hypothetical protein
MHIVHSPQSTLQHQILKNTHIFSNLRKKIFNLINDLLTNEYRSVGLTLMP